MAQVKVEKMAGGSVPMKVEKMAEVKVEKMAGGSVPMKVEKMAGGSVKMTETQ